MNFWMSYKLVLSNRARKQLKKMDRLVSVMLLDELLNKYDGLENPRQHGKALKGELKKYWRYRIGNYRIICDIQDDKMIVLALEIGHRKEIYQ